MRHTFWPTLTSKLSRKVALAVFASLVAIEAVILVPSYLQREEALTAALYKVASTTLESRLMDTNFERAARNVSTVGAFLPLPEAMGLSVFEGGEKIVSLGAAPNPRVVDGVGPEPRAIPTESKTTVDLAWRPEVPGSRDIAVALRLDKSAIATDLRAYVLRIAFLVLLIAVVVTATTMISIWLLVLRPLRDLRDRVSRFREVDAPRADAVGIADPGDEIEHLARSFDDMTARVAASSEELLTSHQNLEALVNDRTRKLTENESRLADFANTASDWFWETDETLRWVYFSDRFEEVTGVPPSALIGKTRAEVGAPGATDEELARLLATMDAHEPFQAFVHHRDHPTRGRVYLSISAKPVFRDGVFVGYRGTGTDITGLKNTEVKLREAIEQAQRANNAKSEFLAVMSHELRTPLNAILGFSDVLASPYIDSADPEKNREYAGYIRKSGEHLLSLINDLLDISMIEAGKKQLHLEDVDIRAVIDDCARAIRLRAAERDVVLDIRVEQDDIALRADSRAVRQVLLNLLSNATKFTEDKGTITLEARREGDSVVLAVADTGIGMSADQIATAFDPFSRAKGDSHKTERGWGLGLTISHSLVELHDGTLGIESEPGRGTTVTVSLPSGGPAP
jgi:PAS domain S-box-containing protein